MATTSTIPSQATDERTERPGRVQSHSVWLTAGRFLASLKVTVALFAAGIFLVFVGTLAQVDKDMWEVMHLYFFSWITPIEFKVLFPRTWFPNLTGLRGFFYFPGGMAIGVALAVNLVSAHAVRFKVQARGRRLYVGMLTLVVGVATTALIIISGHNQNGLQGSLPIEWRTCWLIFQIGLVPCCLGLVGYGIWSVTHRMMKQVETWLLGMACGLFTLVCMWVWFGGESSYLGDSGMRILWQLILGTVAAGALLSGCMLLFKGRGGIVLIHGGVGLLMFGQLFVNFYDKEEQMTLVEGDVTSFARDIRSIELVFIDPSKPDSDAVVALPLTIKAKPTTFLSGKISAPELPVDFTVLEYMKNADLKHAKPDDKNPANRGEGRFIVASPAQGSGGAAMSDEVDLAAAYIQLFEKGTSQDLGTYLLAQEADIPEEVVVGGKTYQIFLRFARSYKPYQIELVDVRKDDYVGTSTPKNYSSDIRISDKSRNVDATAHVWMNNPLRYAGETFYQSGYKQMDDGSEVTTLAIVRNTGWMIPYVACMLVVVGLTAHFSGTLLRFLGRVSDLPPIPPEPVPPKGAAIAKPPRKREADAMVAVGVPVPPWQRYFVVAMVGICALWTGSKLIPRRSTDGAFQLDAFGALPVLHQGRAKPLDTLARTSLVKISDRDTFKDEKGQYQPAIRWLLDVISGSDDADKHKVIRIQNLEVLDLFGLERRSGYRYAIAEITPQESDSPETREKKAKGLQEFEEQVRNLRERQAKKDKTPLSVKEQKLLELDERVRVYTMLSGSFQPPPLPPLPDREEFEKDRASAGQKIQVFQRETMRILEQIERINPPLVVPVRNKMNREKPVEWMSYARAWTMGYIQTRLMGEELDPATEAVNTMLVSYKKGDVVKFNQELAKYQENLARRTPDELDLRKLRVESAFNQFSPFSLCNRFYLLMFALTALGLLAWVVQLNRPFNNAAFWIGVLALSVHTAALLVRIYLSGRPPVTNLYSSAVYIGWFCVLAGIVLEAIFRLGIGNLVASMLGYGTLVIAQQLSTEGDTLTVLQAVLDTQFWLATHVVCISTGYATTFLAGVLGIAYIVGGLFTRALSKSHIPSWNTGKLLATMIYGVVCFSLVFSFTGTVLGGLWADDSWGRFWGWDPKENGALIIVLWNALILHARWGKMVGDRGLAVLAVVGNIVTSWSWFGVNELGVGLHSYGFTEGVLLALGTFVASQLAIVFAGMIPKSYWSSFAHSEKEATAS